MEELAVTEALAIFIQNHWANAEILRLKEENGKMKKMLQARIHCVLCVESLTDEMVDSPPVDCHACNRMLCTLHDKWTSCGRCAFVNFCMRCAVAAAPCPSCKRVFCGYCGPHDPIACGVE